VARVLARAGSASTLSIALGAGLASLSMNFWIPFLPLYMLHLGATSDANAFFWVAVATTGQGFARSSAARHGASSPTASGES
jgi:hypothetical protein